MDYRQTLLVLLSVLLCSSQGLTESSTEATLVQTPSGTSTEMMNELNRQISELTKMVIRHDEMNTRIMTRLDEMNSESVKRFEENNSTMFSLFDNLDKKTQKNSDESLTKLEEIDNKIKSLEVSTYRKEKQFVLFTESKNWTEAYNDCTKRNMMLASIESEEENNKVRSLFKNADGDWFWLSGTDLGHTGRFVWKSTGRDVTYNQWQQGEPTHRVYSNGEVEHCMEIYSGTMLWHNYSCSHTLYYICHHWV